MIRKLRLWTISLVLSTVVVAATIYFYPKVDSGVTQEASRCPSNGELTDELVAESLKFSVEKVQAVKAARALNNNDLCTMPLAKLERAVRRTEKPKADQPGEWAKFRAMQQADESGTVKPDGLATAIEQRHEMLALRSTAYNGRVLPPAAGISQAGWTGIGPGNIGGRMRTIVPHPTNANKLWLGSVGGGIWTTDNGGTSWTPVNDFMGNLAVSTMTISPDGNTLYAGTGEGFFNGDALRGQGIFKSTDGGVTWNQLANATPTALNGDWFYVNRLVMHPTNDAILLAATNNALYKTEDAGATWNKVVSGVRVLDVKFNPADGAKAVLSLDDGTISYTSNTGTSWANSATSLVGRAELAYGTANVVYASADHAASGSGKIWKSTDGGVTWAALNAPGHLGNQGWYDNTIWVDPTNNNHVVIGGLDLYRSTDGGVNWSKISQWFSADVGSVHADHHAIVSAAGYDGTSNKTVYFGNDGGIYKASDITAVATTTPFAAGWTKLNNGLAITQFYSGAGHNGTNGRIIGGAQDNGSLRYAGTGTTWTEYFGGDGGQSDIDPADGNYIYGEYTNLTIHRSTDGGVNTAEICNGIGDANADYCTGGNGSANFIAPFALDSNNSNTLLAGGVSLWRSLNVKAVTPTWAAIKNPATGNSPISALTASQGTGGSDRIWVGHNNGELYKTTDGTAVTPTWSQSGSGTLPSNRMLLSILVDKDDHNKVYVSFGGYSTGNIWRTTDGGTTWTDISANLPQAPIRSIQRHPTNANYLYVGTEVGIFSSEDGGTTWNTTNDGPANVSVDKLFWLDSTTLAVATHGRGMFKTTVGAATDTTPDAFTFTDQTGVALSTVVESNAVTVAGINAAANISITGGEYSINSGAYTSTAGTVTVGQTVKVRHTSSGVNSTAVNTVLTIGGVSDTFTTTTLAVVTDTTPDAFTFTDQTGVALSTVVESNAVTVAGINAAANISITGGEYSINSGAYTSTAGTVTVGQTVKVRHTSSGSNSHTVHTVLMIGGISDTFSSSTVANSSVDSDGDGVSNANDTSPNDAKTASPPSPQGGHIALVAPQNLSNVAVLSDTDPSLPTAGKPSSTEFTFPDGVTEYTVNSVGAGATITVTLTFPTAIPAGSKVYKITAAGYAEFTGATISGNTVTLTLVDGGAGDSDNAANGTIVDPVAVAVPVTSGSGGSGGGGGGSFPLGWSGLLIIIALLLKHYRPHVKGM